VFVIALAFAAAVIYVDSIHWGYKPVSYELLLNGILAILATWTISGALSRRQGVRQMILPLTHWQINALWYVVAIGLWPTLVLLGNFISPLLSISVPANPWYPNRPFLALLLKSFAWYALFGGPLNEEPGWRGFALPRLQRRFSPLTSGLIIGVLMAFWHVPLHLIGAYPYGPAGVLIRIPDIATGSIFACLYNCSSSSLLPVLLLHASRNTTSLFLGRSHAVVFSLWLILAAVLVVPFRMWRRIPASTAPPD
jgi:membrane protease YdiL (CAAX protease family)